MHEFPVNPLTETYAFDYFIVDIKTDHAKFAHICQLCAKVLGINMRSNEFETLSNEDKQHVTDHMGVFSFKCSDCSTWFKTINQADQHLTTNHSRKSQLYTTEDHFGVHLDTKLKWDSAVNVLIENLNLTIDSFNQFDTMATLNDSRNCEDIQRIVKHNEFIWNSLHDIRNLTKDVFLVCGDWHQIAKIIQSSSISNVKKACIEIKKDFEALIMHPVAFHSMATLLVNCDDSSWNSLMVLVENPKIRSKFYDSIEAGHFFRKLMTTESFSEERYQNLAFVFNVHEIATKKARSLFFSCVAVRHGPAAIALAQYATDHVRFRFIM